MTWWGGNSIPDTRITEWPTTENCYNSELFPYLLRQMSFKRYLFLDKGHFITVVIRNCRHVNFPPTISFGLCLMFRFFVCQAFSADLCVNVIVLFIAEKNISLQKKSTTQVNAQCTLEIQLVQCLNLMTLGYTSPFASSTICIETIFASQISQ